MAVFLSHLLFCRGAVCGSARAASVFAAFNFALWGATASLAVRDILRGGGGGFAGLLAAGRRGGGSAAAAGPKGGAQRSNVQMKEVV